MDDEMSLADPKKVECGIDEGCIARDGVVEAFGLVGFAVGCVFLKSVNLRLSPHESSDCGSVWMFRDVPGITWGDRCWSAGVAMACRAGFREAAAVADPPVPGRFPGSWGGINPDDPQ
jgi:hypothetical protein